MVTKAQRLEESLEESSLFVRIFVNKISDKRYGGFAIQGDFIRYIAHPSSPEALLECRENVIFSKTVM